MKINSILLILAGLLLSIWMPGNVAHAADRGCKRDVFLTIGGNISLPPDSKEKAIYLSEADIIGMTASTITTSTAWTPASKFDGVLLSDLMKRVGAKGSSLRVTAIDNYIGNIPWDDLKKYEPVLVYSRNGIRISRKEHGPLFVIYPRDKYPEVLNTPVYTSRYVWQVCRIDVK